jgi:PAS domain S-box-containing protein
MTEPASSQIVNGQVPEPDLDSPDVLHNAPIGIFTSTPEGRYLFGNTTLAEMLGYETPQELFDSVTDIASQVYANPDERQEFMRLMQEHGKVVDYECRFRRKDGAEFWASINAHLVRDEHGRVQAYQGFTRDITERKQDEDALLLTQFAMDRAPDSIVWVDADGKIAYANDTACSSMGFSREELLDMEVFDIDPDFSREAWEQHKEDLEKQKRMTFERRHRTKDGSLFPVEVTTNYIEYKGHFLGISFDRDITERKQAEEALHEEAVRRKILVDQSRDGIVILSEDGSVHEANKRYAEMLGYTPEEVSQLHVWDWDTQWTHNQLIEMFQQVDEKGDHFETRHRRKDGTFLDVEISTNGAVIGGQKLIFCVCRDITDRKRAEYENAKNREMLLQAEILAKLGSLEWDIPNDTWFVSDNWRCIMGHESPHLSSSELFAYVHPEDKWRVKRAIAKTMSTGKPYDIQHRILQGGTGEVCYIQTYGVLELNNSGKPVRGFGTIQDITDRKQAEEKIRATNEQLHKANAEKDKLFSIIAHDLKSPMSGLVSSTEMLADQSEMFSEQDIRTLTREMHKSVRNTFALLEDLLQWSRMNQGGIDYAPTPCSLNELLNMGLSTAQDLAKSKGISLRQDAPQGLTVLVDQPTIKTVIRNILFNAVKFTRRGGEIAVSAKQEGPTATVAMQDTGVGMNEQVLSSIFTLEKEKRQLGTEGEKGTGLGLILCKQFIEQHGGSIWVESESGKGTTVFFTLPVND